MKRPTSALLQTMLKTHGAAHVHRELTSQGYTIPRFHLEVLRDVLVASGEARILGGGASEVYRDPADTARQGSDALLRRQLVTGQHSLRDPHRIAALLQGLEA